MSHLKWPVFLCLVPFGNGMMKVTVCSSWGKKISNKAVFFGAPKDTILKRGPVWAFSSCGIGRCSEPSVWTLVLLAQKPLAHDWVIQTWPPLEVEARKHTNLWLTVGMEWHKLHHESPFEKAYNMFSVLKNVALRINLIYTLNRCRFHFRNWHLNFSFSAPSYTRILIWYL